MFFCEFCKTFKNTFYRTPSLAVSVDFAKVFAHRENCACYFDISVIEHHNLTEVEHLNIHELFSRVVLQNSVPKPELIESVYMDRSQFSFPVLSEFKRIN